ncbi:hypothetical protein EVAR_49661_1 [Eumeta japonica]|uniref:Uncharacterized protein n=1 Tax=Eumeta variegata TaxID=151549 RepID=A0A4C1Y831_EUMVA|nr:hypothetical protein EVAR_49661_1 [Eumeta japonica]
MSGHLEYDIGTDKRSHCRNAYAYTSLYYKRPIVNCQRENTPPRAAARSRDETDNRQNNVKIQTRFYDNRRVVRAFGIVVPENVNDFEWKLLIIMDGIKWQQTFTTLFGTFQIRNPHGQPNFGLEVLIDIREVVDIRENPFKGVIEAAAMTMPLTSYTFVEKSGGHTPHSNPLTHGNPTAFARRRKLALLYFMRPDYRRSCYDSLSNNSVSFRIGNTPAAVAQSVFDRTTFGRRAVSASTRGS